MEEKPARTKQPRPKCLRAGAWSLCFAAMVPLAFAVSFPAALFFALGGEDPTNRAISGVLFYGPCGLFAMAAVVQGIRALRLSTDRVFDAQHDTARSLGLSGLCLVGLMLGGPVLLYAISFL